MLADGDTIRAQQGHSRAHHHTAAQQDTVEQHRSLGPHPHFPFPIPIIHRHTLPSSPIMHHSTALVPFLPGYCHLLPSSSSLTYHIPPPHHTIPYNNITTPPHIPSPRFMTVLCQYIACSHQPSSVGRPLHTPQYGHITLSPPTDPVVKVRGQARGQWAIQPRQLDGTSFYYPFKTQDRTGPPADRPHSALRSFLRRCGAMGLGGTLYDLSPYHVLYYTVLCCTASYKHHFPPSIHTLHNSLHQSKKSHQRSSPSHPVTPSDRRRQNKSYVFPVAWLASLSAAEQRAVLHNIRAGEGTYVIHATLVCYLTLLSSYPYHRKTV